MKVLFLDIDGVLNSSQSTHMYWRKEKRTIWVNEEYFCPISISNLLYIFEKVPDLKIVVSSTWRILSSLDELKEIFKKQGFDPEVFIDTTPRSKTGYRGTEIRQWITEYEGQYGNPLESFSVVDDNSDMDGVRENFVQTNGDLGLMIDKAEEIIKMLTGKYGDYAPWVPKSLP